MDPKSKKRLLCATCTPMTEAEIRKSTAVAIFSQWQDKLAEFWSQFPGLIGFFHTGVIWLGLTFAFSYYPETRAYAVYPALLAVLTFVLGEWLPLRPIPYAPKNVVSSRFDAYTTGGITVMFTSAILLSVGGFALAAERLGNFAAHNTWGQAYRPPGYWSTPLPWVSLSLVVFPIVYFSSLLLSKGFVEPKLVEAYRARVNRVSKKKRRKN